jgi:hypothetical protein
MRIVIILFTVLVLYSCSRTARVKRLYENEKQEFAKKTVLSSGDVLLAEYMPSAIVNKDSKQQGNGDMQFHISLVKDKNEPASNNALQEFYQTDSLFSIVYEGDTIWPLHILPVANGLKNKREYIALFPMLSANKKSDEFLLLSNETVNPNIQQEPIRFKLSKINQLEN